MPATTWPVTVGATYSESILPATTGGTYQAYWPMDPPPNVNTGATTYTLTWTGQALPPTQTTLTFLPVQIPIQAYAQWQQATPYTQGADGTWQAHPVAVKLETPAQRRARRRQARLDDLAAARAKALLLEHLSAEQRDEYQQHRYFHVLSEGGRLYRIRHGSIGNVDQVGSDGTPQHRFCIHARDPLPAEDNMLIQMLLLRFDEERFLQTANMHW